MRGSMKITSLAFVGLALTNSAIQAANYSVTSLVQADSLWSEPAINDTGDFTWGQHDGNDWEIHLYEASSQTTRQLTNNNIVWDFMNAPNAQGVTVWSRQVPDGNGSQPLHMGVMDVNTGVETTLYTSVTRFSYNNGGDVAWVANDNYDGVNPGGYDVYLYKAATGTTTLLQNNDYADAFAFTWTYLNYKSISDNGSVVWLSLDESVTPATYLGNVEVYYYNGDTGAVTQLTHNGLKEENAIMAPNGDAMWSVFDGNDYEIMYFNAATGQITALTDNNINNQIYTFSNSSKAYFEDTNGYIYDAATNSSSLVIDAAQLGWGTQINGQGDLAWAAGLNIFKYTASTGAITQLSNDDSGYSYPDMNEQGDVTWISNSGTGAATSEIFVYSAADGVVSQLSNNNDTNYWPQVNALGEVIWGAWNETDVIYHIYKAVPDVTDVPVAQCQIQALPANSYPAALNNNGDVLLHAGSDALIWNNGETIATISIPGLSSVLYMQDLNDNRQVVATSSVNGLQMSFLWENNSVRPIGSPDVATYATRINNQGQVAGYYTISYQDYAMIWSNGEITELGKGRATDINNAGDVSGYFNSVTGKWSNGVVTPYGTLPGFMFFGAPAGINDNGQMTAMAFSYYPSYSMIFTMSDNGNVTGLGAYNDLYTIPYAINNSGTIVGTTSGDGNSHLVAFKDGAFVALTDLLPENSGWSALERPVDINESGQVLGSGVKADGSRGYFLMSDCL